MHFLPWLMVSSASLIKTVVVPGGITVTQGIVSGLSPSTAMLDQEGRDSLCLLLHPQCLLEHRRHPIKYLLNE